MEVIGVIPARYESQRLPHKLLRKIMGKPILQWTWENVRRSHLLDRVIIACDSQEVMDVAAGFGAEALLTSPKHASGTDRIAEAVRDIEVDVVINIQADEPLIHPSTIDALVSCMVETDCPPQMATVKKKIDDESEIRNTSVVKVVTDKDGYALYFSRYPIPYLRDKKNKISFYKHIGIYAYTKDFLYTFKNLPPSYLEMAEKLEQLRALENGYRIKVIETQFDSWGVDTEDDLKKVEEIISERGYA